MKVLGVDPGSLRLGYGLILTKKNSNQALSFGIIEPRAHTFVSRLGIILHEFSQLLDALEPDVVVFERLFLGRNVDSAFKLGHARGIVMSCAALRGLPVVEYSPREVKKGVTGYGHADKNQLQVCVLTHLRLRANPQSNQKIPFDATDALALALHHTILVTKPRLPEVGF